MSLRDFGPQNAPMVAVPGTRDISWLELSCRSCGTTTYVQGRQRRLARVGSNREYTVCVGCGARLTLGRLVVHPNGRPILERLRFWRREPVSTVEA